VQAETFVYYGFALLWYVIGLEKSRQFVVQSVVEPQFPRARMCFGWSRAALVQWIANLVPRVSVPLDQRSENERLREREHSRPQSHDPSDLRQGSRALAGPDFLNMCRVFVSYSQPIRFARFDGKSVNRGLPVLDKADKADKARALDPLPQDRMIVGSGDEDSPGASISGMRIDADCAVMQRMGRIRLFPLLFRNDCSQSLSFFDRWSRGTKTLGARLWIACVPKRDWQIALIERKLDKSTLMNYRVVFI